MRNKRGALGALFLAGAAYLWTNRDKLGQQLNSLRQQRGMGNPDAQQPHALPDLSATEQRDFGTTPSGVYKEREFGGTKF